MYYMVSDQNLMQIQIPHLTLLKKKPVLIPGLCKALEQASVKHLICWEHFTNGGHFQWVMLIPQRLLPHRQFGLPFLHWVVPCTLELVLPLVTAKK
jgi:hypothetical protein